eukprot:CAMPEP_0181253082 /NCGR_PEP_ID=MMETSP1096-20121128/47826_1 /TAXON_ID=156174 ORGANISM="Chrysochromulina ericina, Strain CCMP281" /NCGR_SAMPLE_ID=MMETSP1096 /ASSEMBLY_ACC=CAM_ASM_000453 /LENGTH=171 /DNA_ID=CAMNT_0023350919 /DNA_START=12 /DNA_END=527 /DNA_ORIENTATION=+
MSYVSGPITTAAAATGIAERLSGVAISEQFAGSGLEPTFPSRGFANGSRVEVYHCTESHNGPNYWMYLAPGSGIFFDLGRTYVASTHGSLRKEGFGRDGWTKLKRLGYDSVQFTHVREDLILKFEVVDLRQFGVTPWRDRVCPDPPFMRHYTRGWGGAVPCLCDPPLWSSS